MKNFTDKITTDFSPIATIALIVSKLLTGLSIDKLGWKVTGIYITVIASAAATCIHYAIDNLMGFYFCYWLLFYAESSLDILF